MNLSITLYGSPDKVTVPRHQPGKAMRNIDLKSMKIYLPSRASDRLDSDFVYGFIEVDLQMREMENYNARAAPKISRLSKLYGSRGGWGRGEYRNCARCHHDRIAIRFD